MKQTWIIGQNTIKALIRKKDLYVFFMMLSVLLVFLASENFFGVQDISRYVKDIGFSCLWIFSLVIAVTFSAKQLPEEIDSRTIFTLLAKPVARAHVVLGRFLGSLLAASSAYTVFFLLYIGVVFFKGEGIALLLVLQSYILGICFLSMVCAVAILFSLCMTLSAAIVLSFIIYFAVMWFADSLRVTAVSSMGLSSALSTVAYYLVPHYEFYDLRVRLVHSWEALPVWVFFAVVVYAIAYTSIILCLSQLELRKRVL